MHVFDLHCDTLYKALTKGESLLDNNYDISLKKGLAFEKWVQCMAIWIPDDVRGDKAFEMVESAYRLLNEQSSNNTFIIAEEEFADNQPNFILTVEGGAALAGELDNILRLKKMGVRMLTLTWNGTNELGDGIGVKNGKGLTIFGKEAVKELEKNSIIIDVSHASEKMFYDVAEISSKPFVASHSNSQKICANKRNLSDEQFAVIAKRGGLVGLNFCTDFLNDKTSATAYDVLKHTEYFLSLGGEDVLALGTDYDGAVVPNDLKGIEKLSCLYDVFLRENYKEELIQKIFYNNAYNFFKNFDK